MTRLLIIGGGGHGAVVAEAAIASGSWSEILFLDDELTGQCVLDHPVAGSVSELSGFLDDNTESLVAIGNNRQRLELLDRISENDGATATVIHPKAWISPSATISPGVVICAGVIVNARASIGPGCILNTGATIDHDCVIHAGAHISPGANLAGCVTIGMRTWVGIGSSVREGINIGKDSIVGAGAAVVEDVNDGVSVGGVPARELGDGQSDG